MILSAEVNSFTLLTKNPKDSKFTICILFFFFFFWCYFSVCRTNPSICKTGPTLFQNLFPISLPCFGTSIGLASFTPMSQFFCSAGQKLDSTRYFLLFQLGIIGLCFLCYLIDLAGRARFLNTSSWSGYVWTKEKSKIKDALPTTMEKRIFEFCVLLL